MKRSKGFTLLELVIVFIIIGVMLAIAVPRFFTMSSEAHAQVVENAAAALMQSTGHLSALHKREGASGTVNYQGVAYSFVLDDLPSVVVGEYPVGPNDLVDGNISSLDCANYFNSLINGDLAVEQGSATSTTIFESLGTGATAYADSCQYNYLPDKANSRSIIYNYVLGRVDIL